MRTIGKILDLAVRNVQMTTWFGWAIQVCVYEYAGRNGWALVITIERPGCGNVVAALAAWAVERVPQTAVWVGEPRDNIFHTDKSMRKWPFMACFSKKYHLTRCVSVS